MTQKIWKYKCRGMLPFTNIYHQGQKVSWCTYNASRNVYSCITATDDVHQFWNDLSKKVQLVGTTNFFYKRPKKLT